MKNILVMNGGICDQIVIYERYCRLRKICPDLQLIYVETVHHVKNYNRNWQLTRLFPNLPLDEYDHVVDKTCNINVCRREEVEMLPDINNTLLEMDLSHFRMPINVKFMKKYMFPVLDDETSRWLKKIKNEGKSVGLHIRRGDLTDKVMVQASERNRCMDDSYIRKIVKFLDKNIGECKIYVFSDDIEWCKKNVKIDEFEVNFIDCNDVFHGYLDLYLLSKCDVIVGSNGSMGLYAWHLSDGSKFVDYNKNINRNVDDIIMESVMLDVFHHNFKL